jgi:glycosyltransferase involved in cell wall biosynthesis
MSMATTHVLGLEPRFFIRPNNTDWRHSVFLQREFLASRKAGNTAVCFDLRNSMASIAAMNGRYLKGPLGRRFPRLRAALKPSYYVDLHRTDHEPNYDVLYSYGCYPRNATRPVVWHTGPTDVETLRKRGVPQDDIDNEIRAKADCAGRARIVAVSSDNARDLFDAQFPGHLHKIRVLPFVLPQISPIDAHALQDKHRAGAIHILFVGREARRKGLDLLLQAYEELRTATATPLSLTIVSSLADGPVSIPARPDIRWLKSLDYSGVQQQMAQAQVFAMPSREESYGLVYLEAMAAGAACLGPDREPQRSIIGDGVCGLLCEVSISGVRMALDRLVHDTELRLRLAVNGRKAYEASFSRQNVLPVYESAFSEAATPR